MVGNILVHNHVLRAVLEGNLHPFNVSFWIVLHFSGIHADGNGRNLDIPVRQRQIAHFSQRFFGDRDLLRAVKPSIQPLVYKALISAIHDFLTGNPRRHFLVFVAQRLLQMLYHLVLAELLLDLLLGLFPQFLKIRQTDRRPLGEAQHQIGAFRVVNLVVKRCRQLGICGLIGNDVAVAVLIDVENFSVREPDFAIRLQFVVGNAVGILYGIRQHAAFGHLIVHIGVHRQGVALPGNALPHGADQRHRLGRRHAFVHRHPVIGRDVVDLAGLFGVCKMRHILVVIARFVAEQTGYHVLGAVEDHKARHRVGCHRKRTYDQRRHQQIPENPGNVSFLHLGFLLFPLTGGSCRRQLTARQAAGFHLADGEKQFFRFHTV